MIGRLSGTLLEKRPPGIMLETAGVGYELDVPMSTFYELPAVGQSVRLLTHLVVREDAHLLYGFISEAERSAFRALIKVSGVGPRIALAVLSGMSVDALASAVAAKDSGPLTRVPGIGKKTAERLVLELQGKLLVAGPAAEVSAPADEAAIDICHALMALGYSEREAASAARKLPAGTSVTDGIRMALQTLTAR
ncbi:MAG: Holliday junction branch migration protein RuvA [Burkholderiaceae bacterium]